MVTDELWQGDGGSELSAANSNRREATYLVHDEHLVVNLDAQVVGLNNQVVLGTVTVTSQVRVGVFTVVFNPLQ